jgi:23S rRNA pseudouridine2605 synthase
LQDKDVLRLQVFLAKCGVASRRASEKIIADGRVQVNGCIVTEMGAKVSPGDKVSVDGVSLRPEGCLRYILLNKPSGYVCSLSDEKDRPVAADLLKEHYKERLYNVGRLDMFSSGLIIFTNDGDFAARLSHPSAELEKEYIVQTSVPLPRTLAAEFQHGMRIDDVFYRCLQAHELNSHKISITLIEGKNREIRNVFSHYGVGIKSLTRIRIGAVTMDGLASGQFRELSGQEVTALLNLCKN